MSILLREYHEPRRFFPKNIDIYPLVIQEKVKLLMKKLITLRDNTKLDKLVAEKKRPKPLKLYEPAVEKVVEGKRKHPMGEKKRQRQKLTHKLKKEMKGAIREIRRDKAFIAKLQIKETIRSDKERKEKVKDIMGSLAIQAGEINKFDRMKKKK